MAWPSISIWMNSTLHIRFSDRRLGPWTGTGLGRAACPCLFISYLPITTCIQMAFGLEGRGGGTFSAFFILDFFYTP